MTFFDTSKIKVIYSMVYFKRILFLLKIEDRYTMVYKRSGLNGGKKGTVLPFFFLLDRLPRFSEARNGIVTGYIFKEFYFNKNVVSHYKQMDSFGAGVQSFLNVLEKVLIDYKIEPIEQNIDDIQNIASEFNSIAHSYMKIYETEPRMKTNWFDWGILNIIFNSQKHIK